MLDKQPDQIRLRYEAAGTVAEELNNIPCYCGCGASAGHQSPKNCFVSEIREDGTVEWDDHGTRCGVCLEIVVHTVKLKQEGKNLQEIREFIDAAYKEGYAAPTPMPMPTL
ncbi:PCYCGC motif-containing (lipo)protein [Paenibacillus sp. 1001270B_150601_E10]|uniref:PCYCGC motif-containing (lipo)protein n=1 Tax=Paenibacillus sp. 1001270B_150601_E10 TaxID=2787079 RepID=UPI002B4BC15B|nr:PCYCGC motif-containing (lipo)protein [Paenibacillus sp. 1001270B_150601_E10]